MPACERVPTPLGDVSVGGETAGDGFFQYNREYVFVAYDQASPLVVPFSFQAVDNGSQLERTTRGWLARGNGWDRFLDDGVRTSRAGGVWRVVPDGDLTVLAGGPTEVEALHFQRADRRLRLDIGRPITGWNQDGDTRFRLMDGAINIGGEVHDGSIVEVLRVDRATADGWPAARDFDAIYLTASDSSRLLITKGQSADAGEGFAWMQQGANERAWEGIQMEWSDMRPYDEARREIPRRWSFGIPSAQLTGEVEAAGFDVLLGPERGGRRAVEIRYTVQGWIESGGERRNVVGMIRHTQL